MASFTCADISLDFLFTDPVKQLSNANLTQTLFASFDLK